MSNWTDFRDSVVDSLKFDTVTDNMKEQFTTWLLETCLPLAESAAENFNSQVKEQAKTETGWCKVRDLIVLPMVVNGGLWLVKQSLNAAAKA